MKRNLIASTILSFLAVSLSQAASITYIDSAVGSGTLGASAFSGALVTLSFTGDTANVALNASGVLANTIGTFTLTVAGLGTTTISTPMEVFLNTGASFAGFAITPSGSVLATNNAAFGSYDLKSAIGPASGSSFVSNAIFPISTDLGNFTLNSTSVVNSTFTATLGGSVAPEPGTCVTSLLGFGSLIALVYRRFPRTR